MISQKMVRQEMVRLFCINVLLSVTSIAYAEADVGSVGVACREEIGTTTSVRTRSRLAVALRHGMAILQNMKVRLSAAPTLPTSASAHEVRVTKGVLG